MCALPGGHFQLVVFGKIYQKRIGHRFSCVEVSVYKNTFVPFMGAWLYIRGISHAPLGTKGRHHATDALRPVTRPKGLVPKSHANNDEIFRLEERHKITVKSIVTCGQVADGY